MPPADDSDSQNAKGQGGMRIILAAEYALHCCSCFLLHIRQHMTVEVKRNSDAGMAKQL